MLNRPFLRGRQIWRRERSFFLSQQSKYWKKKSKKFLVVPPLFSRPTPKEGFDKSERVQPVTARHLFKTKKVPIRTAIQWTYTYHHCHHLGKDVLAFSSGRRRHPGLLLREASTSSTGGIDLAKSPCRGSQSYHWGAIPRQSRWQGVGHWSALRTCSCHSFFVSFC